MFVAPLAALQAASQPGHFDRPAALKGHHIKVYTESTGVKRVVNQHQ